MKTRSAKAELVAQCGCGARFVGSFEDSKCLVMALATDHARETGHTMEILGTIRPE